MRTLSNTLALCSFAMLAQTTQMQAQDFYPVETRNTWSYQVLYNNYPQPPDSETTQLTVAADTVMPNGHTYRRLTRPDALGAQFVRVDSNYVYYCSPTDGLESPVFNLRAAVGFVDTIAWGSLIWSRVASIESQSVFGLQRTVRRYAFDGLEQYEISLADGFGIIDALAFGDGIWPYYSWWHIRGSIIRDTLYGVVLSVPEQMGLPAEFGLMQNYPNPFNPTTTIEFQASISGPIRLFVMNLLGQEVAEIFSGHVSAGEHQVTFNAAGLASGMYFYSLSTPVGTLHRSLIVLK